MIQDMKMLRITPKFKALMPRAMPRASIRDDQISASQAALLQVLEKAEPAGLVFLHGFGNA